MIGATEQREAEPYCNHDADAVIDGVCECGAIVGETFKVAGAIGATEQLRGICPRCGQNRDGSWDHTVDPCAPYVDEADRCSDRYVR